MFDLSIQQYLARIVSTLVILGTYGLIMAAAARWLGDKGPQYDGRLTANPLTHASILGTLTLLVAGVGWIRPMRIEPKELRRPRLHSLLVVIVTLGGGVALTLLLLWSRPLLVSVGSGGALRLLAPYIHHLFVTMLTCSLINLLPVPPLVGGHALYAVSPALYALALRYERWLSVGTGALLLLGVAEPILAVVRRGLLDYLR